jgi:hypothetical protein
MVAAYYRRGIHSHPHPHPNPLRDYFVIRGGILAKEKKSHPALRAGGIFHKKQDCK